MGFVWIGKISIIYWDFSCKKHEANG